MHALHRTTGHRVVIGMAITALALLAAGPAAAARAVPTCSGGPLTITNTEWDANWNQFPAVRSMVDCVLTMSKLQKIPAGHPGDKDHQVASFRINNPTGSPVTVSSITFSGAFRLNGGTVPVTIPARGSSGTLTVLFTATSGDANTGSMTIQSSAGSTVIGLGGFWQSQPEHGQEPNPKEIALIFGQGQTMMVKGRGIDQHGLVSPVGDEVLSPYWTKADTSKPILVRQLAAFHKQGQGGTLSWWPEGNFNADTDIRATPGSGADLDGDYAQTVLPQSKQGGPVQGTIDTNGSFGLNVGAEKSDDTMNFSQPDRQAGCPGTNGPSVCGHHMRFWPVKDSRGNLVPNTYYMSMDYAGINYDYNDQDYLIANIRPTRGYNAASTIKIDAGASNHPIAPQAGWMSDAGLFSPAGLPDEDPNTGTVKFTNDQAMFSSYRGRTSGPFTYTIHLSGGAQTVDVVLDLAERFWTQAGKRVFSISAGGQTYSPGFDIFQQAGGQNRALPVGLSQVRVPASGNLVLTFQASVDHPAVNGIEVHCAGSC